MAFGWDDAIAIAAIGADVGMGFMGMNAASQGASAANELQYRMFREQMDFQERMYKNRHTYEVDDLRRAGLNPILSANSAASSPMGSSPVSMQNVAEPIQKGLMSSGKELSDMLTNIAKSVFKKGTAEASASSAQAQFENAVLPDRIQAEKAKLKAETYTANSASDWFGRMTRRVGQGMSSLGKIFGGGVPSK